MRTDARPGLLDIKYSIYCYILIACLTAGTACGHPDSSSLFFYQGLGYGSQAVYNPGTVIVNGGYGIWQVPVNYGYRKIFAAPYRRWWENNWRSLGHPLRTIGTVGWGEFLATEVFPFDPLDRNREQFVPNYFLHGIGAGMHFRATAEWYQLHGFPRPRLWSLATMAAYHLLTEVVENGESRGPTLDPIADFYVFNPAGILLFSSDRVCGFFSRRLGLAEWSQQPCYNARTGNLENMGQFYVMRYPLKTDRSWSALAHFGLHGMAGVSRTLPDGRSYSASFGLMVENLESAAQEGLGGALAARLSWSAGLFYDRHRSLMASLMVSGLPHNKARLNVYPGMLRMGSFSPGISASWGHELVVGINAACFPLGAAWSSAPR